jgi:hemin uptake protein HemP
MPEEASPTPENDQENDQGETKLHCDNPEAPMLPKIIKFDTLARCGDEIWIEHNGQIYRLRKTRQDKLILTK